MTSPTTGETVETAAPPVFSSRRRRLPSPAEQARRVAWGKRFGALNGAMWKLTKQQEGIE